MHYNQISLERWINADDDDAVDARVREGDVKDILIWTPEEIRSHPHQMGQAQRKIHPHHPLQSSCSFLL
jgi:hypothetical protein